jgi:CelD/BcsL family acetyltransferase involved in cellulose biosynthesis
MADTIAWVEDPARFEELAEPWERLLDAEATPFDRHWWFQAWRRAFAPDRKLAVCTAWRDGELSGVLPMVRSRAGLQSMSNLHTPSFRPLARDDEALEAVVGAALRASGPGVELLALAADGSELSIATRQADAAGRAALVDRQHVSPYVDTRGDFEDWKRETKSRWHANVPRLWRKMMRDWDAEFLLLERPHDLDRELERGLRVEASGWKGERGTAILSSPETARFYRDVARALHERGELRMSTILLDGRAVAFDLSLVANNRLYVLKTGYDEEFRKQSPGLVLRMATIERCFEEGLESQEFLGDDAGWKRKFDTGERVYKTLRAYSTGPRGRALRAYRTRARPRLRAAYKKTLGRNRR